MTSKLTITREQATDKEIQMLIDSHENGTAMFLRVDAYYFMAKELQERRKAERDSEPVGKPFMYGIADPDGNAYIDELCVSEDLGLVEDAVNELNYDREEGDELNYSVVALYRHAQPTLTPYAWSYDWACCVTCEGPQDFEPVIEREPPPQWAIDEGRVKNLITLYRTAQPAPVVLDEGRADFEAWMLNRWGRERRDDDFAKAKFIYGEDYADSYTRCVWKAWSASRAAILNGGQS